MTTAVTVKNPETSHGNVDILRVELATGLKDHLASLKPGDPEFHSYVYAGSGVLVIEQFVPLVVTVP